MVENISANSRNEGGGSAVSHKKMAQPQDDNFKSPMQPCKGCGKFHEQGDGHEVIEIDLAKGLQPLVDQISKMAMEVAARKAVQEDMPYMHRYHRLMFLASTLAGISLSTSIIRILNL